MYFASDAVLDRAAQLLSEGKSFVVITELYCGNGKWKLDKYRYKMIVPITDSNGNLYSTDVFAEIDSAEKGEYGIYYRTQQKALRVVDWFDADYNDSRFGHGYTEEEYGRVRLKPDTLLSK